jgi:hypothetical protein
VLAKGPDWVGFTDLLPTLEEQSEFLPHQPQPVLQQPGNVVPITNSAEIQRNERAAMGGPPP